MVGGNPQQEAGGGFSLPGCELGQAGEDLQAVIGTGTRLGNSVTGEVFPQESPHRPPGAYPRHTFIPLLAGRPGAGDLAEVFGFPSRLIWHSRILPFLTGLVALSTMGPCAI